MKKFLSLVFAGFAMLAPLAYSDEAVAVKVAVPVDSALLVTEDGTATVLNKIKSEARRACAFDTSISYIPMVNKDCVSQIVAQAEAELKTFKTATAPADLVIRASFEG